MTELATIVHGAGDGGLDFDAAVRAVVEASLLAGYDYRRFKSGEAPPEVVRLTVVEREAERLEQARPAVTLAEQTANAVMLARELGTGPANLVTPTYLAERAREVAEREQLEYQVFWKEELQRQGMNAILAVNAGSGPAALLGGAALPDRAARREDAGGGRQGHHLRQRRHLDQGRRQHGGHEARHVRRGRGDRLHASSPPQAKLPINVLGVFAATENLPSGTAYKPGDVYQGLQRQDDGDRQHRRRGSGDPVRRAQLRRRAEAGRDHRPGDPDRRLRGGARATTPAARWATTTG